MSSTIDRREFVCACARTLACAALAGCASIAARRVPLTDGRIHLPLLQHPELGQPDGSLKILPDGYDEPLYVLRLSEAEYTTLSPICTHRGCTVEIEGPRLVCPCHGSTYDRAGRVVQGPAQRSLTRYPTSLSAEGVVIIDARSRG